MTFNEKIRYEMLQYRSNRETVKISALSLTKLINMNILQVEKYYLHIKVK